MPNFLTKILPTDKAWFLFLSNIVKHYIKCKCSQISASLTYTTLLSIVPILTVLLIVLSSIPILEPVREQVYNHLYTNLMPESGLQLKEYLSKFTQHFANLTIMGIIVLLVTTIVTLFKIEMSFNHIWQISTLNDINKNSKHSSTRNFLLYFGITLSRHLFIIMIVPIILGIAFLANGAIQGIHLLGKVDFSTIPFSPNIQESLTKYIELLSSIGTQIGARVISFLVTALGFTAMYWFIPKAKVEIKSAFHSGVIIAIFFEILKYIFGWIIGRFTSYATVYGAFAVFPTLIIWINLSWHLILLGVVISYCHQNQNNTKKVHSKSTLSEDVPILSR